MTEIEILHGVYPEPNIEAYLSCLTQIAGSPRVIHLLPGGDERLKIPSQRKGVINKSRRTMEKSVVRIC